MPGRPVAGRVSVLAVQGLRKTYGSVVALQGLDLDVPRGEVFGFLGPNGAGKTTFTKCVTGFVRPDRGSIDVMGIDARAHPTRVAHHVGLVPDQYDFYPNLTGRQHLDFYGRLQGLPASKRRARIEEVLALVRMTEGADRRTKAYSHGMKQRICIAQALLHEPELVFFDEPTNGLDPKGAYELREMIRGLARGGTTIFLNSHLLHEVEQTCRRVAVLDRGRLLAMERVDDLRRRFSGGGQVQIRLANPSAAHVKAVAKAVEGQPRLDGDLLLAAVPEDRVPDAVAALVNAGGKVLSVQPATVSLEQVFLKLTEAKE